jgi:glycosyltransferase involved in cell wall biosynthesis
MAATAGDAGKVHLVPTYVDTGLFRQKSRYDFSAPILYVGRLTPQKNLAALIAACGAVRHELHLIGIGPQQAELERAAGQANAKVRFLGRVPNERLAEMMQDYTVFALPSLHEGLPKVLIEAMASGMICMGTDIPGISDLIVDGKTGYLAENTSPKGIEKALRRCLAEQDEAIGAAARQAIEEQFSIETYARTEGALLLGAARTSASDVPMPDVQDAESASPGGTSP